METSPSAVDHRAAFRTAALLSTLALLVCLAAPTAVADTSLKLPWKEAGLSEREAAVHLLSRFSFGPRPGEIDRVLELGVAEWALAQLAADLPDPRIESMLADSLEWGMSAREMVRTYPSPGQVLREAARAGLASEEELGALANADREGNGGGRDREELRAKVLSYAREKGYRFQQDLREVLLTQKLLRSVYSENQLTEVLTDFWYNHFHVSLADSDSRIFVYAYERDAIRPHVLGSFREMLEATAKHPAMLLYLDNARSVAEAGAPTYVSRERRRGAFGRGEDRERRRPQGLNENYARELLELHTLGVDGGYDQEDVVAVARAFTGWATIPPAAMDSPAARGVERLRRRSPRGFVFEEDFVFRANAHDAGPKDVLGRRLSAGRGIEDGLEVLDLLASHPSTSQHLARKLAVRFVSDEPPAALVERMAEAFRRSKGDIRQTLMAMLSAPEFWAPEARRAKIKSPLELAASALRALGAEVMEPRPLLEWIRTMGQPLYAYQAPTGFPDRAEAWVNTGSLLNRMNFGLELATGRVSGLRFDLGALNGHREPESLDAALETYVALLLPAREPTETLRRLRPMVHSDELAERIEASLPARGAEVDAFAGEMDLSPRRERGRRGRAREMRAGRLARQRPPTPIEQVVGVILGSPEFQRR